MRKKSKWLFALLILLIVFISIRILIYINLYNKVENDAKAINECGRNRTTVNSSIGSYNNI